MNKHLIAGVDPGTTTGVALLDLKGRLVGLTSSKDMGLSGVVDFILKHGVASLIACDVSSEPGMISKLSSTLGVDVYKPEKSLTVSEKIGVTRGFKTGDSHQRDALAAALNSFSRYKNLFKKIESRGFGDEVKHLVLQGYSIEYGARMLSEPQVTPDEVKKPEAKVKLSPEEKRIRSLEKRIKNLSMELGVKDAHIVGLKEEIASLKRRNHVKPVRHDSSVKTIRNLEFKLKELKKQLSEEKSVRRLLVEVVNGNAVLVGVYPEVTRGYTMANNKVDGRKIKADDFKAVFTDVKANVDLFKSLGVPVHEPKLLKKVGGMWFADRSRLKGVERVSLEELVEDYRKGRRH
jgi:predicted RNase H-like nuclease (RuvC/YqgF family)